MNVLEWRLIRAAQKYFADTQDLRPSADEENVAEAILPTFSNDCND